MKKNTKIITLILSALLLIGCAIGIMASAEETAPTVTVKYKNISYEGAPKVLYAVEATNVPEGAEVKMAFFDTMPTSEDATPDYLKDECEETLIIGGVEYKAFFSDGIAPKNMRKNIYAVPVILEGGKLIARGDVVTYSIFTYGINMLSKTPTAEQKALYTSLLDYGASVQRVLLDSGDYTEEELALAGGYADEYCGVKISTVVDNSITAEGELLGYFAPGTAVELTAPLYENGAMFTGYTNGDREIVGEYSAEATAYATEPGVTNFYKTYRSDISVNDYTKGYISTSKYYSYIDSKGYTNNYIVGSGAYNSIVNYGTEEAPNYALKHSHTAGTSSGSILYNYNTVGKAYIFETDFYFEGAFTASDGTNPDWFGRFGFVSAATDGRSSEKNFSAYSYLYAKNNEPMKIEGASIPIGEWVRLRFEFIPLDCRDGVYRGTYRVYKNGEIIADKIMTTDVENSDCRYFQFGNRGSNKGSGDFSFKMDNTLCYTITEDYYGNGLYNDKANDYESGVAFSGGTIVEELNGNKVLEFKKTTGNSPILNIYLDNIQQGSKYVFDTDIQWIGMPLDDYKRTWIGRYGFVSEYTQSYNEDDKFVRSNNMTATPVDGAFLNNSTSGGSLDSTYMKNVKILPGVWYNLRVEYTIDGVDADGYYIGTQSMYLNGELISSSTQKETMMSKYQSDRGVIKNTLGLKGFAFNTLSPNSCGFRLDNTYIGAEGETDLYRYNDFANTVNSASSRPFLGITAKESCVSEHTITANPLATDTKSAANNVLKVVTNVDDNADKDYRAENKILRSPDKTPAQAHGIYELEFDIAIDPSAALPADDNIFMQFVLSSAGGYVQLYRLTHTGDGNVRFNAEAGGTGGGKGGIVGSAKLLDGKWHNVKFVYTKNGTDSSLSIYVDGECIGTKNNCYYMTESAVTKSSVVSEIVWRVKEYVAPEGSEATNTTYYIDNMGFRYAGDLPEN